MKPLKKQYKVYINFTQQLPFTVAAYNVTKAKEYALQKARLCATESEHLEVVNWVLVEGDK